MRVGRTASAQRRSRDPRARPRRVHRPPNAPSRLRDSRISASVSATRPSGRGCPARRFRDVSQPPRPGGAMFEYDQDIVEVLLNDNERFQALYKEHNALKAKVREAEIGVLPMDAIQSRHHEEGEASRQGQDGGDDRAVPPRPRLIRRAGSPGGVLGSTTPRSARGYGPFLPPARHPRAFFGRGAGLPVRDTGSSVPRDAASRCCPRRTAKASSPVRRFAESCLLAA